MKLWKADARNVDSWGKKGNPSYSVLRDLTSPTADGKKFRKPTRTVIKKNLYSSSLDHNRNKTYTYRAGLISYDGSQWGHPEGVLSYTPATRTVTWSVENNNHSVDRAHETWMWALLKSFCDNLTDRDAWTRTSVDILPSLTGGDSHYLPVAEVRASQVQRGVFSVNSTSV